MSCLSMRKKIYMHRGASSSFSFFKSSQMKELTFQFKKTKAICERVLSFLVLLLYLDFIKDDLVILCF